MLDLGRCLFSCWSLIWQRLLHKEVTAIERCSVNVKPSIVEHNGRVLGTVWVVGQLHRLASRRSHTEAAITTSEHANNNSFQT